MCIYKQIACICIPSGQGISSGVVSMYCCISNSIVAYHYFHMPFLCPLVSFHANLGITPRLQSLPFCDGIRLALAFIYVGGAFAQFCTPSGIFCCLRAFVAFGLLLPSGIFPPSGIFAAFGLLLPSGICILGILPSGF